MEVLALTESDLPQDVAPNGPLELGPEARALRFAAAYALIIVLIGIATLVVYACGDEHDFGLAMAAPVVLWLGAVAAFARTWWGGHSRPSVEASYRAGAFLVILAITACAIPATGLLQTGP
jgi:hypothetical protein